MTAPDGLTVLTPLLQGLCLVLVLWLCVPALGVLFLGVRGARTGLHASPGDATPQGSDEVPECLYEQLSTLGFAPLGVHWERAFGRTFREHIFLSADGTCFATVYRLFVGERPRVAFLTAFADGAVVLTQNYAGGYEADEPDLRTGGVPTEDLARVLAEHQARVGRFRERGRAPREGRTLEDFADIQNVYANHPTVSRALRFETLVLVLATLAVLGVSLAVMAWWLGLDHPAPWAFVLLECLAMVSIRVYGAEGAVGTDE